MGRNPNVKCSMCEKPFYKRPGEQSSSKSGKVFCSKECYGLSCRVYTVCPECGTKFSGRKGRVTCSRACSNKRRTGIKYSGERPKDKAYQRNVLRAQLIALRGAKCERCSYSKAHILQVHHILERSNGGTDEVDNLLLLCPNCHCEEHYGRYPAG